MKMDYANSNEKRAHDLLAPLTGACPDSVWEVLNTELEARRLKAKSNWLNNINISPKVPLTVAGVVGIIALSVWGISGLMHVKQSSVQVTGNAGAGKQVNVQPASTVANTKVTVQPAVMVATSPKPAVDNNNNANTGIVAVRSDRHKKHIDSIVAAPVAPMQSISLTQNDNSGLVMSSDGGMVATPAKTNKSDNTTGAADNQSSVETVVVNDVQ